MTGVCSTANVAMVRSLGADHVIDYTKADFTRAVSRYDLILDNIENRSLSDVRHALAPRGALVLNSGTGGMQMIGRFIRPLVLSPFVQHRLRRYLSNPNLADLEVLTALIENGTLRPIIDSSFPLTETPAAFRRIESGYARGKVVIAV